jgi:DNA-binding transcriptional ArsR family regulator
VTDPPDEWLSRAFAALSDPVRRDIIARLTVGDATVSDLAAPYDMSLQAVSKHVKVLADAGLVSQRKEAQRRPVHLESRALAEMTGWIERHQQRAEQRMTRLEEVLADLPSSDTTGTSDTHGAGQ